MPMASSSVVIKVKYEESFRRFNARIHKDEFCFNVAMLKEKIRGLFDLEPDIDFTLTYIDEDGDAVTIADEYDLCEAARQSLDPIRLTVRLKDGQKEASLAIKDECHFRALFSVVTEFLKAVPESHHQAFWTLLFHWTKKPESHVAELASLMDLLRIIQLETGPDPSSCTTMGAPDVNDQHGSMVHEHKGSMNGVVECSNDQQSSEDPKILQYIGEICLKNKDLFKRKKDSESGSGIQSNSFGFGASNPDYLKHCLEESDFRCPKTNGSDFGIINSIPPFKNSYSDSGNEVHMGVNCAGCGVNPIHGPRFASTTRPGYNLCSTCFEVMGYDAIYTRICPSVSTNFSNPNGFSDHHSQFKLDSSCILDVEILDGAIVAPCTKFTKTWWMRNTGTAVWPCGSRLVWLGGSKLGDMDSYLIEIAFDGCPVGHEYDITVDFIAPERPDRYVSYWRMASPCGEQFGDYLSVIIEVAASMKNSAETSNNLNLPLINNGSKVNPENDHESVLHDNYFPVAIFSENTPSDTTAAASPTVVPPPSNTHNESTLMKDLALVGLENVNLKRDMLNMYRNDHGVDLEWDPILDELQELGFPYNKMKKRLLKNNGGIRDLINGGA